MPSYLDLGVLFVIAISALASMVRGFTREVLAIASWVVAGIAAYSLYPMVVPIVKPYIQKDNYAMAAAIAVVFFVVLILVSIITIKVSDAVLDSTIGAVDRSLGLLFGIARGLLLCVVAYLIFVWLTPDKPLPDWAANSRSRYWLEASGNSLKDMIPADTASRLLGIINKGGHSPTLDELPADSDNPASVAPSTTAVPATPTPATPPAPATPAPAVTPNLPARGAAPAATNPALRR